MSDEEEDRAAHRQASRRAEKPGAASEEMRRVRQAEALRRNLARRKAQSRSRRAGGKDETEGLPAASAPSPNCSPAADSDPNAGTGGDPR